jgi:hypothetical protein
MGFYPPARWERGAKESYRAEKANPGAGVENVALCAPPRGFLERAPLILPTNRSRLWRSVLADKKQQIRYDPGCAAAGDLRVLEQNPSST